jgi:glycosyltransferase involved in cell wall biosynthesis
MKTPEITIIITAYNAEKTIIETLKSVKNQTFENWECIIVDDNSKDDTLSLIEKFIVNDNRFKIIVNSKNIGQAKALNIGVINSKSTYIMFLDSDDLIDLDCLERRIKHVNPKYDFLVFPNVLIFKNKIGDIKQDIKRCIVSNNPLRSFLIHELPLPWNIMSVLWKKESLLSLEGFNEKYPRMVDAEISTRALIANYKYKIVYHQADHFYRTTNVDFVINEKRMQFYQASTIYITEILKFTKENNNHKLKYVKRYLSKFVTHILALTIVSPQFNLKETKEIIVFAFKNNLINKNTNALLKNTFTLKLIYPFFKLPVIRNVIWHSLNFYVNKK